ncbi:MAG: hypothetical protein Q9211_003567, partial [Gyalolechia sp. 1 TL-2023]
GGVPNIPRPSIDDIIHASNENASIDQGRQPDRLRKAGGGSEPHSGDWWRDEMASGRARN